MALALFLTLAAIGADLLEPIVYRFAIDDLAGVFVHREASKSIEPHELARRTAHAHHRGTIQPRTMDQAFQSLLTAAAMLLGLSIVWRGTSILADQVTARYTNTIEQDFITSVYRHVLRLPLSFFASRSSAAIAKQIDQSDQVAPVIRTVVQDAGTEAIRLTGILAIMFAEHPNMALVALATVPAYVVLARRMARRLEGTTESYYAQWENVADTLQDSLSAVKTVKLSGAEDRVSGTFRSRIDSAFRSYLDRNTTGNTYVFWQSLVINLAKFGVFVYGGLKVVEHQLTPGDVVMFVAYLDRIYDPIDELASHYVALQNHRLSVVRAIRLLGAGDEEAPGEQIDIRHGDVEFDHVAFSYVPGRRVLNDVSFVLPPGSFSALVGPSGAGKTTMIDLLLKLYTPDEGAIRIDGREIRVLDPSLVRQHVGVVSADGAIFKGTVRQNILFKAESATPEEVEHAVDASGLRRMVERLPDGLETEIGERGVGLSLGERQRIQIARILVSKPKILVLDEATANLDYATEAEIRSTIDALHGRSTILVVAHRYSMVHGAERVIVMEQGRIAVAGTLDDAYRENAWFRDMVDSSGTPPPREG